MTGPDAREAIRTSYDRVAAAYADHLLDELAAKPLDRAVLDVFADAVRSRGRVADVGCGPGQVARYLADRGVEIEGLDVSPQMISIARARHPGVRFRTGDLFALPYATGSLAGLVAFYAIVNLAPGELAAAFAELRRTLTADGRLLISFHVGDERVHRDEMWQTPVDLDFWLFPRALVEDRLLAAGFELEAVLERRPYPEVEYPSQRAYLIARARSP